MRQNTFKPPVASAAIHSKVVVLLLRIHCLSLLHMFVGLCLVLLCNAILSVLSNFALFSLRKRELVALLSVLAVMWLILFCVCYYCRWEHSGSSGRVPDSGKGAAGSSLTGATVLCT